MYHIPSTALLVQVIHVLCDYDDLTGVALLELCKGLVGGIWRCLGSLSATCIVKIDDQCRIARKSFRGGDVFDTMLRPKPVFRAEGF
jgi:hypothetical protein